MFKTRTLFVVGAGASCEVNLPMGAELKDIIAKLNIRFEGGQQATGDNQIGQSLRHCGRQDAQFASYLTASRQIAAAMPLALSIDNFIDAHKHNQHIELCGKLAIVKSILEAERKSKLHMRSNLNARMNFSAVSGSWYEPFFQRLTEGISRANIAGVFNNVSFITFNYDRCIEHYLLNALQTYYTIPFEEAGLLVNQLVVYAIHTGLLTYCLGKIGQGAAWILAATQLMRTTSCGSRVRSKLSRSVLRKVKNYLQSAPRYKMPR